MVQYLSAMSHPLGDNVRVRLHTGSLHAHPRGDQPFFVPYVHVSPQSRRESLDKQTLVGHMEAHCSP